MPRRTGDASSDDAHRSFAELVAGMTASELEELTGQILAIDVARRMPQPPPSRRRPRSASTYTVRVRADLAEVRPPLWRRLELASTVMLDELHDILQAAFGWEDRHLHRFALGGSAYDIGSEKFLCPEDIEEGETTGIPTSEVRLDEVLAAAGDTLTYAYDYGDGWEVRLQVEAVLPRGVDSELRAVCTDGRRGSVTEDSGGPAGHDARARRHPERDRFDLTEANLRIAAALAAAEVMASIPPLLLDMLEVCLGTPMFDALGAAITEADLHLSGEPAPEMASRCMARYQWLLDLVGADGVELTAAGRLAPAHVELAFHALGIVDEWYGKGNREAHVYPVQQLRETATRLGLVRRHRGRLRATRTGSELRTDPMRLFAHVAGRLPGGPPTGLEHQTAMLELLLVAAGRDIDHRSRGLMAEILNAYGWTMDGRPLPLGSNVVLSSPADDVLRVAGAFEHSRMGDRWGVVTPEGRLLARAALRHSAASPDRHK